MNGKPRRKNPPRAICCILRPLLFTLIVTVVVVLGLRQTEVSSRAEGLRLLEQSVRSAALRCYVVEGSYPESIAYIEQHYGVYVDRTRYAVFYEIFAPNLMPAITVTDLEASRENENVT